MPGSPARTRISSAACANWRTWTSVDGDARRRRFVQSCKSRNEKDLHDPLSNAVHSAYLCHLANIGYRTGRKLTLEAGPKFTGDAEATRMLTRDVYRKPYVV